MVGKKPEKGTRGKNSDKILNHIAEQRGIEIPKSRSAIQEILSSSRVEEFLLTFDSKSKVSILSTPENLLANINSYYIVRQALEYFLGAKDFEDWFENFAIEFRKDLPSSKQALTSELTPWGQPYDERPGKRNLLSPQQVAETGSQTIIFYPNRKKKGVKDGVLVEGTYYSIQQQLLDIMRSGEKVVENPGEPRGISERKFLKGFPEIVLVFKQTSPLDVDQTEGLRSELSVSLTKYSEKANDDGLEVVGIKELKHFRAKIVSLFVEPKLFNLERGRETHSYQDWRNGYGTWSYFNSEESAISFYQRFTQIKGDTFQKNKMGGGKNKHKDGGGETVTILGEPTKMPKRYRSATLSLWYAYCFFPASRKKIVLVSRTNRWPVDDRLL